MESQEDQKVFYFAYGSNTNATRMRERCSNFDKRESAKLNNYSFQLNKVRKKCGTAAANIKPCPGSQVYGALYTCNECVLKILDVYEGVKTDQYYRDKVNVELEDGSTVEAVTYIAHPHRCKEDLKVKEEYIEHCLGGKDLYPEDYIKFLESHRSRVIP